MPVRSAVFVLVGAVALLLGTAGDRTVGATDDGLANIDAPSPAKAKDASQSDDAHTTLFLPTAQRGLPPWPQLTIVPSLSSMRVGETVSFVLGLETGAELDLLSIDIRFDPGVLQVLDTGAAAGTQVVHGDFPVVPGTHVWAGVMEHDGWLSYGMFRGDREGSKGSGALLAFDLLAVAEGASELSFDDVQVWYATPRGGGGAVTHGARVEVSRAQPTAPMRCPHMGNAYRALSVNGARTDRPADEHPDLNLAIRGYAPAAAYRQLVDYQGAADMRAPQLAGLVPDAVKRGAEVRFAGTFHVSDWIWETDRRGGPIRDWPVSMAQLGVDSGVAVRVPGSGYGIGEGMQVLVLYANPERLTLKYTRDDNVVRGYTLHLENVCVDPALLSLYERADAEGRGSLPALSAGQVVGVARQGGVRFAIRDSGQFMDPRARKDWWRGW